MKLECLHLQCPRIVALLAESYNPHVRYGAAMAVGLACSASGLPAAMRLLEPLMKDAVDFVRQGALIASALVLMQQPESKVSTFPHQHIAVLKHALSWYFGSTLIVLPPSFMERRGAGDGAKPCCVWET